MKERLRVIMIGAHPDDCEDRSGGTIALWTAKGAEVQLVSVANGDAGHFEMDREALAQRRRNEAKKAAGILGASSLVFDNRDGEVQPSLKVREQIIRSIRLWRADIVITHRANDYHPDHRYTSQAVQDAAYIVQLPHICPETPRLEKNPVFMYFSDWFQEPKPFRPDVIVDVDPVMEKKWLSLDAHDSQFYEWLPWIDGLLEQVPEVREDRLEWLKKYWAPRLLREARDYNSSLRERYGAEHAAKVRFAEAYQLCEYGARPSREELWKMFP